MTEPTGEPRLLVPTDRQRDVGDAGDYRQRVVVDEGAAAEASTRSLAARGLDVVRQLDPRGLEGPTSALAILCLTSLFARIDEQALGVLLPQIRSEFGVNLAFLATLASLVGIFAVCANLPSGYLADRVRRVWVTGVGTMATGATVVAQAFAPGVGSLVATRLANGFAQGIAPPASFSLQTDLFPPRTRSRVFALFFGAAQLGLILGPIVAGFLGGRYGWRTTLILLGAAGTVSGLLVFLIREPVRGATERKAADGPLPPPLGFGQAYKAAASIRTIRKCWYATPLLSLRGTFSLLILPAYFSSIFQFSTLQLGFFVALTGLSGFVGLLIAGVVGDRILANRPGRYMVIMGLVVLLQASMLVALSFAPNLVVAIVATQVTVMVETALQPAFYTLISLVVPVRLRGLGLATNAPWQLMGLLAAPFVVTGVERIGIQRGVLLFVPFLVLAAAILASGASGVQRDIRAVRAADRATALSRNEDADVLLVCRDVDVEYDGVQVLFGVDLDVRRGEIVALVGTNGAGKSTLLRAIAGTQEASNGAIFLNGQDITHLPPHENAAAGVVMMPGGAAVFPSLSVAENLRAAAWTLADQEEAVAERTAEVLELFPVLRERLDQSAGSLSGGEQQMVGVSQALLMAPKLLMVDELSLGLSPKVVEQLLDVLRTLNERGTTIVIVEQSLNVALTIADRAVFMEKGTVRFSGPTQELLARPDLVRSVFMGGAAGGTRAAKRQPYVPSGTAPTAALAVAGVGVRFGGITALSDVDISVLPGQVVGIIGPNGAGKTTLFDVVSGFVAPDNGTVRLSGTDVTGASPDTRARLGVGRSFQNARLFPALTVRENIAVALERRTVKSPVLGAVWAPQVRTAERRIAKQVERLVDLLGLTSYADKVLGELSTGSRRAVDVACIIALEPSVLLLDEPSSGLAQAETEALGPLLARIVRETGCGMLVIEHDIPLVTSLADELVAMESGRVLLRGRPDDVRNDPRVLASYLAASDDVIGRSGNRMAALADILGNDPKER